LTLAVEDRYPSGAREFSNEGDDMNYADVLEWCMRNEVTLRTWTEEGTVRVWVCKLLDSNGDERIKMDNIFPDFESALEGLPAMIEEIALQVEARNIPRPVLRLVKSA
jgi:hypothetical protein